MIENINQCCQHPNHCYFKKTTLYHIKLKPFQIDEAPKILIKIIFNRIFIVPPPLATLLFSPLKRGRKIFHIDFFPTSPFRSFCFNVLFYSVYLSEVFHVAVFISEKKRLENVYISTQFLSIFP